MSSLDQPRSHQRSAAYLGVASALLLATSGAVTVAAAQTDASERRQKLAELRDVNADAKRIAPNRLTARGSREAPQEYEDPATEQQTLRRIEVIIEDPLISVPESPTTMRRR